MLRNCFLIAILTIYSLHLQAQTNDSVFSAASISSIKLVETGNNSEHSLPTSLNNPSVLIFLSPECPLCKNYSTVLNALYQQFKNSVAFYGIVPGNTYSIKEIELFKSTYGVGFPLLIDPQKELSNYLQATITPEVILLDGKQQLLYKGAIDNWAVSLGKQRLKPTQFYLKDAIEESLQGKQTAIKRTKTIGCKINDL